MTKDSSFPARIHGGPDQHGVPLHDFSTNSNACGPCPEALAAVRCADATQYPDASSALREQLGNFHGVDVRRIVLVASASEFIFRITAVVAQQGGFGVWLPPHSYGDYAQAARAHGLQQTADPEGATLSVPALSSAARLEVFYNDRYHDDWAIWLPDFRRNAKAVKLLYSGAKIASQTLGCSVGRALP